MNEKRRDILDDICMAINSSNVEEISMLVSSAFNAGYTSEEIKNRVRICMVSHDFDAICEFCRAMHFEEKRIM